MRFEKLLLLVVTIAILTLFFLPRAFGGNTGSSIVPGGGGGVWGAISGTLTNQTDLVNALALKAPLDSPTFTTRTTHSYGTVSTVPYFDASKRLVSSAVTPTQLGFLDATSSIQTQLNLLAPKASPTFTGVSTFPAGTEGAPSVIVGIEPTTGFWQSGAGNVRASCNGTSCFYVAPTLMGSGGNNIIGNVNGTAGQSVVFGNNSASDDTTVSGDWFLDRTRGGWLRLGGRSAGIGEVWQLGNVAAVTLSGDASGNVYAPLLPSTSAAQTGTVCWSSTGGKLTVDTTVACLASTRKIKKNIDDLIDGIEIVKRLRPVAYDLREERAHEGRQVGLVAEEVAEVDRRLVAMDDNGEPRAVRYQQLTAVLVRAIQQQQVQIAELRGEVAALKALVH